MTDIPVWVLDTNVVVSGLLSPWGPPGRLVDALVSRHLRLAFDDRMELEYREVLSRSRLGIAPVRREAFLAILQFQEHMTASSWPYSLPPDRDDLVFLEVALETTARTVVTGNLKHFPPRCRGPVTILAPRAGWERLADFRGA